MLANLQETPSIQTASLGQCVNPFKLEGVVQQTTLHNGVTPDSVSFHAKTDSPAMFVWEIGRISSVSAINCLTFRKGLSQYRGRSTQTASPAAMERTYIGQRPRHQLHHDAAATVLRVNRVR